MEQNLVVENLSVWRYSEIKDYTFGKEPSMGGPVTGHFTQVIDFMIFLRRELCFITMMIILISGGLERKWLRWFKWFDFRWCGREMIKIIWFQVVWKGSTDVGVGVAQEGSKVVISRILPVLHYFSHFMKIIEILSFW